VCHVFTWVLCPCCVVLCACMCCVRVCIVCVACVRACVRACACACVQHSVMTAWPNEEEAIRNQIKHFGAGPFATVMDSYDYDRALDEVLPTVAPLVKAAVCTLYMYIYICIYIYIYVFIYTHTHVHICTYTHISTTIRPSTTSCLP